MKLGMDSEFNKISYKVPVQRQYDYSKITGAAKFPKDKDKQSYIGVIEALSKSRISPDRYKINDTEGFKTDPKLVKFANNKEARITVFADLQKKKGYIPSPTQYSPVKKYKVHGSYT